MQGNILYELLQSYFPNEAAMSWDNVGLLCGRMDKEIKKIYLALDATTDVIEDAVSQGADLLLTHHPMLYSPLATVTTDTFNGRRVIKLIKHGINYISTHTNYDSCRMADLAVERLGTAYHSGRIDGRS